MKDLKNIKYWLFDLENTLYSGDTKVFDQVDKSLYLTNLMSVLKKQKKFKKIIFMNIIRR